MPCSCGLTVAGRPITLRTWPSDGVLRGGRRRAAADRWVQVRSGQSGVVLATQTTGGSLPHARWVAQPDGRGRCVYAARPRALRQVAGDVVREWRERGVWADRILRLATMPVRRGGPIWLIGERTDTAQDNGRAFFQHVRTQHPERRAYYVIKRGAKNAANVLPLGNVVWHDSLRHRILALQADALVGSHSIDRYLLPRAWAAKEYRAHLAWRIGSKRVYLKHGVLGVRTLAFELSKQGLDIVVASGKPEADYMRSILGYDRQIKQTGLPRYDLLVPRQPERVVVLMPTWRQVPRATARHDRCARIRSRAPTTSASSGSCSRILACTRRWSVTTTRSSSTPTTTSTSTTVARSRRIPGSGRRRSATARSRTRSSNAPCSSPTGPRWCSMRHTWAGRSSTRRSTRRSTSGATTARAGSTSTCGASARWRATVEALVGHIETLPRERLCPRAGVHRARPAALRAYRPGQLGAGGAGDRPALTGRSIRIAPVRQAGPSGRAPPHVQRDDAQGHRLPRHVDEPHVAHDAPRCGPARGSPGCSTPGTSTPPAGRRLGR